jgi:N-acetylglucosamine-6-phosphate deacetylase
MEKHSNGISRRLELPGLVDLQVNGFRGVDFSDPHLTEAAFARACRELLASDTTAFVPTLITSPTEVYERNLPLIARVIREREFRGRVPGVHVEGPFLSPLDGARGAHNPEWMREPDIDYFKRLVDWADGTILLLTIAADRPGAEALTRYATEQGITVCLGHHMADEDDLERLANVGARALTHLGNGIPASMDRHANPVWAGLANDELWATIITDGHHLPVSLLKTIIRAKGPERCVVISDASPLAGMAPGRYRSMGANVVLEENGHLYNPATGYMAGSSATMRTCTGCLAARDLVTREELVNMVWHNPLSLIGLTPSQIRVGERISLDEETHITTHKA